MDLICSCVVLTLAAGNLATHARCGVRGGMFALGDRGRQTGDPCIDGRTHHTRWAWGKARFRRFSLRRALMTFVMEFTHRPNPSVVNRTRWSDVERAGASVFQLAAFLDLL